MLENSHYDGSGDMQTTDPSTPTATPTPDLTSPDNIASTAVGTLTDATGMTVASTVIGTVTGSIINITSTVASSITNLGSTVVSMTGFASTDTSFPSNVTTLPSTDIVTPPNVEGLSAGAIAGIVVGAATSCALALMLTYVLYKKNPTCNRGNNEIDLGLIDVEAQKPSGQLNTTDALPVAEELNKERHQEVTLV